MKREHTLLGQQCSECALKQLWPIATLLNVQFELRCNKQMLTQLLMS